MWAVSFPHLVVLSVVVSAVLVVVVVVAERIIVCIITSIVRVNPSTGKVPGILLPLRANHCPTTRRWMHSYPEASTAITITITIITIIRTMKIAAWLVVLAVRGVWRLDVALRT